MDITRILRIDAVAPLGYDRPADRCWAPRELPYPGPEGEDPNRYLLPPG